MLPIFLIVSVARLKMMKLKSRCSTTDIFKRFKIPLPVDIKEQKAIAAALSDVDGLLAGLDRLIAKKRAVKTGAMQKLLTGEVRVGEGGDGRWEEITFADLADKKTQWSITGGPFGSNLKSSDYTEKGIRIIQLQNIGDGEFLDDYQVFTSLQKADELIDCNIYPGEIVLSKMGDPVARACIVPDYDERYVMCSDGIRLKIDGKRFDTSFVHAYLNSPFFRGKAIEASTGSTRQRIGLKQLKKLSLSIPPLNVQQIVGSILADMDAEIAALEARRAKTQALKQGMMQELLTGRTRLV